MGVTAVEVAGGWTIFRLVAVAAAARGRGLGSEGLRALEEAIRAEGRPCRFRGLAGVGNGRALYFWLRLGYRPEAEAAAAPGGGIRLVRESCQEVHP